MTDLPLSHAIHLVEAAPLGSVTVHSFFDEATFTATRVVRDPATRVFQKRPFMQIAQLHLLASPEKLIAASNRMAP